MPATLSELLSQRIEAAREDLVMATQELETATAARKDAEIDVVYIQRSIETFQRALDFENARLGAL